MCVTITKCLIMKELCHCVEIQAQGYPPLYIPLEFCKYVPCYLIFAVSKCYTYNNIQNSICL